MRRARSCVLSLAAGLLPGAALLLALPRALGDGLDARSLCAVLLAGLLLCFVLEKCAILWPGPRWRVLAAAALPAAAALGWWWAAPTVLVLAAAAALYVALSRLLPLLRTAAAAGAVLQLSLLFAGAAVTLLLSACGARA